MPDRARPVSIHLPIRDAPPQAVRHTLASLAALDPPADEVLVVHSNGEDPLLWTPVARECARLGPRFRFFHLGRWPGGRAGALRFARSRMVAGARAMVLDPGSTVPRDWLAGAPRRHWPLLRQLRALLAALTRPVARSEAGD